MKMGLYIQLNGRNEEEKVEDGPDQDEETEGVVVLRCLNAAIGVDDAP